MAETTPDKIQKIKRRLRATELSLFVVFVLLLIGRPGKNQQVHSLELIDEQGKVVATISGGSAGTPKIQIEQDDGQVATLTPGNLQFWNTRSGASNSQLTITGGGDTGRPGITLNNTKGLSAAGFYLDKDTPFLTMQSYVPGERGRSIARSGVMLSVLGDKGTIELRDTSDTVVFSAPQTSTTTDETTTTP